MAAEQAALNYRNFLSKKCVWWWALACVVGGMCPSHPGCQCTPNYINCTCRHTNDTPLYISQSPDTFTGKEFVVSGCGKVEVEKLSMNGLNLELLKFVELAELNIQSYSLSQSRIGRILMRNISDLRLESYSLSDIKNCTDLQIINATIENFLPAAVGSIEVRSVDIKDCHIGTVHSRAFSLSKIEKFAMENNYINSFDITSVVIRNAAQLSLVRNAVTSTSFGSISVAEIEKVEIERCSFRQLHSSTIIAKEVRSFSFHHCYVETCESRAFWSVEVRGNLAFFSNEITQAEEDSLLPNHGPAILDHQVKIKVRDNLLTCDCHLYWLWLEDSPAFRLLRETSICSRPQQLKGRRLSQLVSSTDSADNCLGLVEKPGNATEGPSTPGLTKPSHVAKSRGPKTSRPPTSTPNSTTTQKAPLIEEASAEKHEYAGASVNLAVRNTLIMLAPCSIVYQYL